VALSARVSTERQAEAQTVGSQLVALHERAASDGLSIAAEHAFVDDGYSGATLVRPALERLGDLAALGGVEMLYVHSPDRLARKYVHQVLLLEEFARTGVRVVFLNQAPQQTPEDELLLHVQGVIAEYERAKIMERVRRGRRHAADGGTPRAWARCRHWPSCRHWPTRRTATATLGPPRGPTRPATRWCSTRPEWSARCSNGWGATASPLARSRGA
jgi:site-specific DNA recombinase